VKTQVLQGGLLKETEPFVKHLSGVLEISGTSLVSNSFTAPKATGCGLLGLLDGIINSKIGLPSSKNTAVLNGKVEIANSELVEESEG
jgi:hypothetical protein